MDFDNGDFYLNVKDIDGDLFFNVETVARNLGFEKVETKNGKEYRSIRIARVAEYLKAFDQKWSKIKRTDFIPEHAVYLLAMKANNDIAVKFQLWLATEVIPSIRQNGAYVSSDITKKQEFELDNFSTIKRIKDYFLTSNIENLEEDINSCIKYNKTKDIKTKNKIKSSIIHSLKIRKENAISSSKAAFALLLSDAISDLNAKIKFSSACSYGQKISKQNKWIKELEEYVNFIDPQFDEYTKIDCHGFSTNFTLDTNASGHIVASQSYDNWKKKFPIEQLPNIDHIDFNDFVYVWLKFDHVSHIDVQNLSKTFVDMLCSVNNVDDKMVQIMRCSTNDYVDKYKDGKIYVCIKNEA